MIGFPGSTFTLSPFPIHGVDRLPRSSPSSPAPSKKGKRPASASPIRRRLLSSPLLSRRMRKSRGESSDEEGLLQDDSSSTGSYRDLETFQKAQLRQKVGTRLSAGAEKRWKKKKKTTRERKCRRSRDKRLFTAETKGRGHLQVGSDKARLAAGDAQ